MMAPKLRAAARCIGSSRRLTRSKSKRSRVSLRARRGHTCGADTTLELAPVSGFFDWDLRITTTLAPAYDVDGLPESSGSGEQRCSLAGRVSKLKASAHERAGGNDE